MQQIVTTIHDSEIRNVINALDLYTRVGIGQFFELILDRYDGFKTGPGLDNLLKQFEKLKVYVFHWAGIELSESAHYLGISGAAKNYRIVYNIECCLRNIYSNLENAKEEKNSHSVWKNAPLFFNDGESVPAVYIEPAYKNTNNFILYLTKNQKALFDLAIDLRQNLETTKNISLYIDDLKVNLYSEGGKTKENFSNIKVIEMISEQIRNINLLLNKV